ncbi:hypothetical protein PTKIN_Ptkin09bG0255300 [Pterospermum kingtungense]
MVSFDFPRWFFSTAKLLSESEFGKFAVVLYNIWSQRNNGLRNGVCVPPGISTGNVLSYLYSWCQVKFQDVGRVFATAGIREVETWSKPASGFVKCNLDAALFPADKLVGYGMVLRDESDAFLAARTASFAGSPLMKAVEAACLLDALKWVSALGFQFVEFESDAKYVKDAVLGTHGDLIDDVAG